MADDFNWFNKHNIAMQIRFTLIKSIWKYDFIEADDNIILCNYTTYICLKS